MHTKDILADELRKAGLPLMAKMAAAGVYSNGLSLLPCLRWCCAAISWTRIRRWPTLCCGASTPANSTPLTTRSIKVTRIVTGGMIAALAQKCNTPRA